MKITRNRMELEAQGKNPNRVIDNLDDLDREFCQTWDNLCKTSNKLLALYKRIVVRAYAIKEETK